jgi:hypothetical protein
MINIYAMCSSCSYGSKTYYEGETINRHFQGVEIPLDIVELPEFGDNISWKKCPLCNEKELVRIPKEVTVQI